MGKLQEAEKLWAIICNSPAEQNRFCVFITNECLIQGPKGNIDADGATPNGL